MFGFISSLFTYFFGTWRDWLSPDETQPVQGPHRAKPELDIHPNYMQNNRGIWLHWRYWGPDPEKYEKGRPKALIHLVHGLGEHHARYEGTAAYFNNEGYGVFMLEHQGHGSSEGERKYISNFKFLVEDQEQFLHQVIVPKMKSILPGGGDIPIFLLGHSLGGLISSHLGIREGTENIYRACVMSAPGFLREGITGWQKTTLEFVSKYLPKLVMTVNRGRGLSHDQNVVDIVKQDGITPKFGLKARFAQTIIIDAQKSVKPQEFKIPLFALHGTADVITSPKATERFFKNAASADKVFKLYPGLLHEPLNEVAKDRAMVRQDILDFYEERMDLNRY